MMIMLILLNERANAIGHFSEAGLPNRGTRAADREPEPPARPNPEGAKMDLEALAVLAADLSRVVM